MYLINEPYPSEDLYSHWRGVIELLSNEKVQFEVYSFDYIRYQFKYYINHRKDDMNKKLCKSIAFSIIVVLSYHNNKTDLSVENQNRFDELLLEYTNLGFYTEKLEDEFNKIKANL